MFSEHSLIYDLMRTHEALSRVCVHNGGLLGYLGYMPVQCDWWLNHLIFPPAVDILELLDFLALLSVHLVSLYNFKSHVSDLLMGY